MPQTLQKELDAGISDEDAAAKEVHFFQSDAFWCGVSRLRWMFLASAPADRLRRCLITAR
jgi:hypothetical protein